MGSAGAASTVTTTAAATPPLSPLAPVIERRICPMSMTAYVFFIDSVAALRSWHQLVAPWTAEPGSEDGSGPAPSPAAPSTPSPWAPSIMVVVVSAELMEYLDAHKEMCEREKKTLWAHLFLKMSPTDKPGTGIDSASIFCSLAEGIMDSLNRKVGAIICTSATDPEIVADMSAAMTHTAQGDADSPAPAWDVDSASVVVGAGTSAAASM